MTMQTHTRNEQNVIQLPLPFEGYPGEGSGDKGWSYLLANSVAFKKEVTHGIRIQKPDQEVMPAWIARLIQGGQCRTIYVENLSLPEADSQRIRQLCTQYSVTIVNVTVTPNPAGMHGSNVLTGPW
ncbi:deoxyguanosinetriphosphate triphosphohydrolase [Alteromonas sp. ASW11-19]|uniref:Deoxyguanosinetriphosphate triphosphohydrolase n=1 Tax=Alteromonas salexigens TaxID=2982530 RepID=A0ABT2VLP7_9ALTE|nr:deoxyguanosinetriphosphate triphosphohydrolase [Alteromonas salexigens]MCU7553974.1 deoxyguanosinetriphosphate triphosphohydrolase [Alteromonas salexigens]